MIPNFYDLFDQTRLITYFLVVIRTGGILFTVPLFGSNMIRAQLRMAVSIVLAAVLYPLVPPVPYTGDVPTLFLIITILKELMIGMSIGTLTSTLFTGIQLGGYLVDFQMGFSMINVMDPESGASFSYVAQIQNIITILLFVAIGGPRLIIEAVAYSFTLLPPGDFIFQENAFKFAVSLFAKVFVVALTLLAPALIVLMATNVVMGVMARIIPQMNLLVVGFPIKIAVGMVILIFSMQFYYIAFEKIAFDYFRHAREFIRAVLGV
ncbi:MAG: flagellar biosynthetic protein FliR [Deferribacteraceae bacterium]|jgi:flagellar biosynthetic protein FliR|nr:flagellar biosynthetic protein FliR [Deferribacteraceae bacterium]